MVAPLATIFRDGAITRVEAGADRFDLVACVGVRHRLACPR
ncbi:MAG: hypothetical protein U1F51_20870 [Burkholderiales bacterium]